MSKDEIVTINKNWLFRLRERADDVSDSYEKLNSENQLTVISLGNSISGLMGYIDSLEYSLNETNESEQK